MAGILGEACRQRIELLSVADDEDQEPIGKVALYRAFKRATRRVGHPDLGPHDAPPRTNGRARV